MRFASKDRACRLSGEDTFLRSTRIARSTRRYVDYAVRGQGEDTLLELLTALRGQGKLEEIRGLSFKDQFGLHRHNAERLMKPPDEFPWLPFHRVPVEKYLRPSFFGKRTAAHHASIGCPFKCSFCGVHAAYGTRELMESPQRTEAILRYLAEKYGADSVQFYDMNFLPARGPCARVGRTHRAARAALVVRSPNRHRQSLFRQRRWKRCAAPDAP